MSRRFYPVTASTTGGQAVVEGDVLTGADLTALVVDNGLIQLRFTPNSGVHAHLWRWDGDEYVQCMDATNGDWSYFAINLPAPDQITVVKGGPNEFEFAVEWTAFDLSTYSAGGVPYRDRDNVLNFYEGGTGSAYKKITSTRLVKTVVVKRGREGFFVGYHTDPRVGPLNEDIPSLNNETAYGERELGTGGGNWVTFSSAGVTAHHPEFGDDDRGWVAAGFTGGTNRPCWMGIDDATYPPYNGAAFIALQHATFPAEQTSGPWWVADLHYTNITADGSVRIPVCRYIALRQRLEVGAWQFGDGQDGKTVVHFVNEAHDDANVPHRTMLFIGAFPYVTNAFADEPTVALKQKVANRCPTNFEDSGNAEDNGVEFMTVASVRDELAGAVKDLTPDSLSHVKYRAHENRQDFRTWCNANPQAAFRKFQIRDIGSVSGSEVYDAQQTWHVTELECVVAYPRDYRYGAQALLDLSDVLWEDLNALDNAIGTNQASGATTATITTVDKSTEEGAACVFAVLTLRTEFWRATS